MTRAFQSRLERVCSRGEDSRGPWRLTGSMSLQSGFYAHQRQETASLALANCEVPPVFSRQQALLSFGCGLFVFGRGHGDLNLRRSVAALNHAASPRNPDYGC
jgi:hypothetical protein